MTLLNKVKKHLDERFGDLIVKIVLFGSRVDGTARDYSDYDLLIIVHNEIDWNKKDDIRSCVYDLNIELGILFSVQVYSEPEMNTILGKQPFVQNALETGIVI